MDVSKNTVLLLEKLRKDFNKKHKAKAAFRLSHFEQSPDIVELGKGRQGVVQKVIRTSDNKEFAMKIVELETLSKEDMHRIVNEIRAMIDIDRSPFIVELGGFDYNEKNVYIFMELLNGWTLVETCSYLKYQGMKTEDIENEQEAIYYDQVLQKPSRIKPKAIDETKQNIYLFNWSKLYHICILLVIDFGIAKRIFEYKEESKSDYIHIQGSEDFIKVTGDVSLNTLCNY
uniref:mitogen-activated protein kinase kinase n=1 Tax=Ditylenchus dipsaci TaxID=166011 RepID=A0A915DWX1_9BILA